jgi:hypothetical protein
MIAPMFLMSSFNALKHFEGSVDRAFLHKEILSRNSIFLPITSRMQIAGAELDAPRHKSISKLTIDFFFLLDRTLRSEVASTKQLAG